METGIGSEHSKFETRPALAGRRVVITRARPQAGALAQALEGEGALVIALPAIEIRNPASWEPLDQAIRGLDDFDIVLLTSVNGVRSFLDRLAASGRPLSDLDRLEIGAIGPATAAELKRARVRVDFVPRVYQAEGLLEILGKRDLAGKRFLIPRAKVARDLVPRVLTERGAKVRVVEAYETVAPEIGFEEIERAFNPRPDLITFTSSSTVTNFVRLVGHDRLSETLRGVAVASIGPITSGTARELGLEVTIEASESTITGLVEAIVEHLRVPVQS